MKHFAWVDWGKSFAIYSVVLLHTHCNQTLSDCINAYVMPLFFFLSGFLFSYERNPNYIPFVKKRFRQIIIPYLWINLIAYLAWVLALRHTSTDMIEWYTPLVAIFAGFPSLLIHDIPTWSLMAFFVTETLSYPLMRTLPGKDATTSILALSIVGLLYFTIPNEAIKYVPFAIAPAIMGIVFYSLGHLCRQKGMLQQKTNILLQIALLIPSATAFYFLAIKNGWTAYFMFSFSNLWMFCLAAIFGIISFVSLCRILAHICTPKMVKFISYGTLIICGFHMPIFSAIRGVARYAFAIAPATLTTGIGHGIIFSVSALLLCLPIIYVIKHYARVLIDK